MRFHVNPQKQKFQLNDLQEHIEAYCYVLLVFGFKSAKIDITMMKSYLLPVLITNEFSNRWLQKG